MALRPTPPLWITFVLFLILSLLFETLLITACVPPLAGQRSVLSNLHILELAQNSQTVRFGYIAFCTLGTDTTSNQPAQICSSIASLFNPSPQQVASKLPNLNVGLFNMAFFLNRKTFPILPAITLIFLTLGALLIIAHWVLRKKGSPKTKLVMVGVFACLGLALTFAMTQAVALTLTTAAIVNLTTMTNAGFKATRGESSFTMHWLAFAAILITMILAGLILPTVAGGSGGGGDYDDDNYSDKGDDDF